MADSPYSGIAEVDLLEIKVNLLKILKGERFTAQSVPSLSVARRIESLADVRQELVLVQQALDCLLDEPLYTDRTFMKAV